MENEKSIRNPVNTPFEQCSKGQEKKVKILFVCHGMVLTNGQKSFIFKYLTDDRNEFTTSLQLLKLLRYELYK